MISGYEYKHDVYLHVDGTITKRDKSHSERIDGHIALSQWELEYLLKEHPQILIIGMGQSGVLPMSHQTKRWLKSVKNEKKIQIIQDRTPLVLEKVNNLLKEGKKVAGVFHTTC